jgi:hypothetical protein
MLGSQFPGKALNFIKQTCTALYSVQSVSVHVVISKSRWEGVVSPSVLHRAGRTEGSQFIFAELT